MAVVILFLSSRSRAFAPGTSTFDVSTGYFYQSCLATSITMSLSPAIIRSLICGSKSILSRGKQFLDNMNLYHMVFQLEALALGVGLSLRWSRELGEDSFWFLIIVFISLPTNEPFYSCTPAFAESYTFPMPADFPKSHSLYHRWPCTS